MVVGCEVAVGRPVTVDGYSGFKDLVKHFLVDHGYRQVAMIEGPPKAAMPASGCRPTWTPMPRPASRPTRCCAVGHFDIASGTELRRLLDLGVPMDAVVCANDHMAWGCMGLALERG